MEDILKRLQQTKSLDGLNLKKKNDKWDLTNLSVSKPKIANQFDYNNYSVKVPEKLFHFNDIVLQDVDLSYSKLDFSIWENCEFDNVTFTESSLKNIKLVGCQFKNTVFENSNLMNSLLGGYDGLHPGSFYKVVFFRTNLKKTFYSFPKFEYCEFNYCDLKEVDFDGSRFINCSFKGKLDSVFFRGHPKYLQDNLKLKLKENETYNPMKNINFSQAELFGVSFSDCIDLSSCEFPNSDEYLFIKNFPNTFEIAKEYIKLKWKGNEKEIALNLIDNVYLSEENLKNKNYFIDKEIINHGLKIDGFTARLFSVFKEIESKN